MTNTSSLASSLDFRLYRSMCAGTASDRASQRVFFGISALLFAASVTATILWWAQMSAMGGMPMPGNWTMSMTWMRMPGQTWPGAAASFLEMWAAMMAAMMLPSFVPTLWHYRQVMSATGETRLNRRALVSLGYFFVWTVLGVAVFPLGVAFAALEMQQPTLARAVPITVSVIILIAGVLQLTTWKARNLACCREGLKSGGPLPVTAGAAWRQGLHYGIHCGLSCANFTLILLAIGVMDIRAMAAVTAAITVERLAPSSERVVRGIGAAVGISALFMIARAAGFR